MLYHINISTYIFYFKLQYNGSSSPTLTYNPVTHHKLLLLIELSYLRWDITDRSLPAFIISANLWLYHSNVDYLCHNVATAKKKTVSWDWLLLLLYCCCIFTWEISFDQNIEKRNQVIVIFNKFPHLLFFIFFYFL